MTGRRGTPADGGRDRRGRGRGRDATFFNVEVQCTPSRSTLMTGRYAIRSGNGTVPLGEGVYGLQRALKVAGARSILISLWKVNDQTTQELMVSFYENWLGGMGKREAFNLAQSTLREKYPEPFFWGAFVMVGE